MSSQTTEINKKKGSWDDSIRTVLVAFVLALVFRSLFFEPFHIPSGSMKNTLKVGDYLFVSKYSYGYSRYSFPLGFPLFSGRALEFHEPERGDIVVFRVPKNPRIDYIKRIIGLPGDKIQVIEGALFINGKETKREPLPNETDIDEHNVAHSVHAFAETLPNGKVIHILKEYEKGNGPADNTPVYTVPEHHYFMMGDNRDNSRDSRFLDEVGYVPDENIVGKATHVFFSVDGVADIKDPSTWLSALRVERFFKSLE